MRIPVYISVVVISVALCIGWHDHRRLVAARENLTKLVEETGRLGHGSSSGFDGSRKTKRQRWNSREEAGLLATDWLIYKKEVELLKQQEVQIDETMRQRENLLWDRAYPLDTGGWEIFVLRILEAQEVSEAIRRELSELGISSLTRKNPQASLELIVRASALFEGDRKATDLVCRAIQNLANFNPLAAAEWVRKNSGNSSGLVTDETKIFLITGTASNNPKLAFKLIGETGVKDSNHALWALGESARTPEQKSAILATLREHLATIADKTTREEFAKAVMSGLANTFSYGNFGEARRWFESMDLTAHELSICAQQLHSSVIRDETGQWIEWFAEKLPPDESRRQTENMMETWIRDDYQAAGKWLANVADGQAKHTAARVYAEAVFPHDRESAIRCALSVPSGEDRDRTLKTLHAAWANDDPAGAAAFAEEHGIK